jgi:hypothetical protein
LRSAGGGRAFELTYHGVVTNMISCSITADLQVRDTAQAGGRLPEAASAAAASDSGSEISESSVTVEARRGPGTMEHHDTIS